MMKRANVEWRPNTSVVDFVGDKELIAILYKDKDGNVKTHEIPAVFVAIGQIPDNEAFKNIVDLDKDGYIIADENCTTRTEGVFVAGDCRTKAVRQVITAVADGGIAATKATLYIDG